MKKHLLVLATGLIVSLNTFSQVQIDKAISLTGAGTDGKVTGIKSVTAPQDAVSAEVLQKGDLVYAVAGGNASAYTLSLPAITVYTDGMVLYFKAPVANASPVTLNVNTIGARTIKKNVSTDLAAGDILNGQLVTVIYDSATTNFQITSGGLPASIQSLSSSGAGGLSISTGSYNGSSASTIGIATGGVTSAMLAANSVDLSSGAVTNLLPVNRGGTNSNLAPAAGSISYGNGSGYAFNAPGSPNQVLVSGGTGTPTWNTVAALLGSAGADLSGTYPSPTVAKINGNTLGNTSTATGGNLLLVNGSSVWASTPVTGDVTINSAGATAIGAGKVTTAMIATTGVIANTYNNVTVNTAGQVTGGSNAAYLTGNQTIALSGDVTGSGATSIAATVARINGSPLGTTTGAATAAVLQWNGTNWAPSANNGAIGFWTRDNATGRLYSTTQTDNVGIGTTAPGINKLYAYAINPIANATGDLTGAKAQATVQANSYSSATIIGVDASAGAGGNNAPGTFPGVSLCGVKSVVASLWGVVPNAYGIYAQAQINNFQSMTNYYGLYLDAENLNGNGTLTGSNYGVYQASANARNLFTGAVTVGGTNPTPSNTIPAKFALYHTNAVSATSGNMSGVLATAFAYNNNYNNSDVVGLDAYVAASGRTGGGDFTGTKFYGVRSIAYSSWGVMPNVYGIYAQPQTSTFQSMTNYYGLYLDNEVLNGGGAITNLYGVYQSSANAKNYFSGNVSIGTTSTAQKLVVFNGTSTGTYTTSGWAHASDERLKTNIKPLKDGLQKIMQLQAVSYNWNKTPESDKQIGFIAQQVEKVFPEVIVKDTEGNYGMAAQNLTAPLVKAVQELNEKADMQQQVIEELKKEIQALKKR